LAITYQGLQAYLSLPPSCQGVSYSKARQHGLHYSSGLREEEWDSVGIDENFEESATSPELAKGPPGDGTGATNVRAWGRW